MQKLSSDRAVLKNVIAVVLASALVVGVAFFVHRKLNPRIVFVSRFPEIWYPREKEALQQKIAGFFEGVLDQPATSEHCPWLLVVPHAGYDYSGPVAAAAYQTLLGEHGKAIRRVFILSPSHYVDFNGMALPPFTAYQTTLGTVEVDCNVVANLQHEEGCVFDDLVFHREHAIDVQIPWVQTCMPSAQIVPLVVGRLPDPAAVAQLAAALVKFLDSSTVVVVSSDLVHYGKRFNFAPFGQSASLPNDIQKLECNIIDSVVHLDRAEFEGVLNQTGAAVCGKNVIRIALEIARQAWTQSGECMVALKDNSQVHVLAHANSAEIRKLSPEDSEKYESVGYAAIVAVQGS